MNASHFIAVGATDDFATRHFCFFSCKPSDLSDVVLGGRYNLARFMVDELTVLLVGDSEPDLLLIKELEKQNLIVEISATSEFKTLLALVEPALVVHLGYPGARHTLNTLEKESAIQRPHLVVLAERPRLLELRQLNTSLTIAVLADDLERSVLARRLRSLMKSAQEEQGARSQEQAAPGVPLPPPAREEVPTIFPKAMKQPVSEKPSVQPKDKKSNQAPSIAPNYVEPRVIVADDHAARGSAIILGLKKKGYATRLVPLDVAATNWSMVRKFAPTILLADKDALEQRGDVWLQLFLADKALRTAKVISVSFESPSGQAEDDVDLSDALTQIREMAQIRPMQKSPLAPVKVQAENVDDQALEFEAPEITDELGFDESQCDRLTPAHPASPPHSTTGQQQVGFHSPTQKSLAPLDIDAAHTEVTVIATVYGAEVKDQAPPGAPMENSSTYNEIRAAAAQFDPSPETSASSAPSAPHSGGKSTSDVTPSVSGKPPRDSSPRPSSYSQSRALWRAGFAATALVACALATWVMFAPHPARDISSATAPPKKLRTIELGVTEKSDEQKAIEKKKAEVDLLWKTTAPEPTDRCEDLVTNLDELAAKGVPQATRSWNSGRAALVHGHLKKAHILTCEAALISADSMALEGLVGIYLSQHAAQEANRWMIKALSARPDRPKTQQLAGDVQSQLGQPEKARAIWISALGVDGDDQQTLDLVAAQYERDAAEVLQERGSMPRAEILYRRAATLSPSNAKAAGGMATVFLDRNYVEKAKKWADIALSLDPSQASALIVYADLAAEANEVPQAIELYRRALKTAPGNVAAYSKIYKLEHPVATP